MLLHPAIASWFWHWTTVHGPSVVLPKPKQQPHHTAATTAHRYNPYSTHISLGLRRWMFYIIYLFRRPHFVFDDHMCLHWALVTCSNYNSRSNTTGTIATTASTASSYKCCNGHDSCNRYNSEQIDHGNSHNGKRSYGFSAVELQQPQQQTVKLATTAKTATTVTTANRYTRFSNHASMSVCCRLFCISLPISRCAR